MKHTWTPTGERGKAICSVCKLIRITERASGLAALYLRDGDVQEAAGECTREVVCGPTRLAPFLLGGDRGDAARAALPKRPPAARSAR